jgi:hypothetical protein
MPTKINANAMKNTQVANGKPVTILYLSGLAGAVLAKHSVQDQWAGSKQLPQTAFPQPWQT